VNEPSEKSVIPCLEPCAILLEFARKTARLEQQATSAGRARALREAAGSAVAGRRFRRAQQSAAFAILL